MGAIPGGIAPTRQAREGAQALPDVIVQAMDARRPSGRMIPSHAALCKVFSMTIFRIDGDIIVGKAKSRAKLDQKVQKAIDDLQRNLDNFKGYVDEVAKTAHPLKEKVWDLREKVIEKLGDKRLDAKNRKALDEVQKKADALLAKLKAAGIN